MVKQTIEHLKRWLGQQETVALCFVGVMMLPNLLLVCTEAYPWPVAVVALAMPAAVYCLMAGILPKVAWAVWMMLPVMVLGAFQIVLLYLFGGSIIAVDMFTNLFTTNASEAGELLGNIWPAVLFVCLIYIPMLVQGARAWRFKNTLTQTFRRRLGYLAVVCALLSVGAGAWAKESQPEFGVKYQVFPVNVCYNIQLTLQKWERSKQYPHTSANFVFGAQKIVQAPMREVYVMVIGEASRACSWSMFGYERETTPCLERREGVVPFSKVITQNNATHKSVPLMLSAVSADTFTQIYAQKSVITAFKEAGFKTLFLSNQVPNRSLIDYFSHEADKRLDISPHEGELYTDNRPDGEMLPLIREALAADTSNLFIVLHTYGSHFNFQKRYPREFAHFVPDQITSVDRRHREAVVNAYDNSVRYTDYVVDQVIQTLDSAALCAALLYCADHGEDLMDDARGRFLHASPTPTYYQLHVASFAWMSNPYRDLYPENYAAAQANATRESSTANLFHTLTDMAHLTMVAQDTTRSLVREGFMTHPQRYLTDHDQAVNFRESGLKKEDIVRFSAK